MEEIILKKQPKTEIISTRVTPEQREIIEEKAYSSYRTPSMYLRDCALDKKIIVVKGVDEIEYMRYHGYDVQWEDKYKYITFTSPEGWKVRDNITSSSTSGFSRIILRYISLWAAATAR